jgi:hypothetical protein
MIELRLRTVSQLFNTLDPFPFRERDLASDAESYIIKRAQDVPQTEPIVLSIEVASGLNQLGSADVESAIRHWFAYRAEGESRAMTLHFRDARLALLIGVCLLSVCMLSAWSISQRNPDTPIVRVLQESLVIIGWVVLWRPAEMLLYDWVPMVRRRKLFERVAAAQISVTQANSATAVTGE